MRLVAFLETEVGFYVPDEELIPANFENLRAIERMLAGEGTKLI
jgi:acyl carrier protein